MKSIILRLSLLAVLLFSASLFPVPASAQDTPASDSGLSVKLIPLNGTVDAGKFTTVDIVIESAAPTRAVQFSFNYDPRLLHVDKVEEGDYYSGWAADNEAWTYFKSGAIDNEKGKVESCAITLLGGKGSPTEKGGPSGSGVVASLTVTAVDGVNGISDVMLSDVIIADAQANTMTDIHKGQDDIEVTGGAVHIEYQALNPTNYLAFSAAGNPDYYNCDPPVLDPSKTFICQPDTKKPPITCGAEPPVVVISAPDNLDGTPDYVKVLKLGTLTLNKMLAQAIDIVHDIFLIGLSSALVP
jgi:hypothetical protein